MSKFDFFMNAYPIKPPIGGQFGWGAKAKVKEIGAGSVDDFMVMHEHWGKTREEAEEKAYSEAKAWIEDNS